MNELTNQQEDFMIESEMERIRKFGLNWNMEQRLKALPTTEEILIELEGEK